MAAVATANNPLVMGGQQSFNMRGADHVARGTAPGASGLGYPPFQWPNP